MVTDVANIKRLTTAGRDAVAGAEVMDPDTATELVRIFDLIEHEIEDEANSRGGGSFRPGVSGDVAE